MGGSAGTALAAMPSRAGCLGSGWECRGLFEPTGCEWRGLFDPTGWEWRGLLVAFPRGWEFRGLLAPTGCECLGLFDFPTGWDACWARGLFLPGVSAILEGLAFVVRVPWRAEPQAVQHRKTKNCSIRSNILAKNCRTAQQNGPHYQ